MHADLKYRVYIFFKIDVARKNGANINQLTVTNVRNVSAVILPSVFVRLPHKTLSLRICICHSRVF